MTTPRGWRIDKSNRHHKIDAVIAPSKGADIGVSYFAARPMSPLYVLAVEEMRVTSKLFERVQGRLDKFRAVIKPAPELPIMTPMGPVPMLLTIIYTSAALRDMATDSGTRWLRCNRQCSR